MTDEKAEELFQRFVKGCWAIPKFDGMAIGGMGGLCPRVYVS